MSLVNGKIPDALPPPENCDCCGSTQVVQTTNDCIYGKTFGEWPLCYICLDCGASVGCHPRTNLPLGKMADKDTRALRVKCHGAFDPLWKSGLLSRNGAYKWLSMALKIPKEQCHISWLPKDQLEKSIVLCTRYYEERKTIVERRNNKREASKYRNRKRIKAHIDARKRH